MLPEGVGGIRQAAMGIRVRSQQMTELIGDPRLGNRQPGKQCGAKTQSQNQDRDASQHFPARQPLVAANQPRHHKGRADHSDHLPTRSHRATASTG